MFMNNHLNGFGVGGTNPVWSTEYTWTLTTDDASSTSNNNTFRMVVPAISKSISKARITLQAPAATSNIAHTSIGVHTSGGGTVTTPVEILFSGASGINMSASSTALSDETAFSASAGDQLIVVIDMGASSSNLRYTVSATYNLYGKSTASYNSSSSAGLTLNFGGLHAVNITKLEVFG